MSYLLDTDWLLDVIAHRPFALNTVAALQEEGLAVSIVSHGELFEGVFDYPDTDARLERTYAFLTQFETLLLTDPIMEVFGRIRSDLRRRGQLIPDLDLLIAATAVHHDLILLTRNVRHFARVPELAIFQMA